jgi:hypothetical protein
MQTLADITRTWIKIKFAKIVSTNFGNCYRQRTFRLIYDFSYRQT